MEKQNLNLRKYQLRNAMTVDARMLYDEGYTMTAIEEYFRNAPDYTKEYSAMEIEEMIHELI